MVQQTLVQNGTTSSSHRAAQAKYWKEHSATATVEAMMLDSQAKIIDKQERPEVRSWEAVQPAEINNLASTRGAAGTAGHETITALRWMKMRQFGPDSNVCQGVHATTDLEITAAVHFAYVLLGTSCRCACACPKDAFWLQQIDLLFGRAFASADDSSLTA